MWIKNGDFDVKYNSGSALIGSVDYNNSIKHKQRISLLNYGNQKGITIEASKKDVIKPLNMALHDAGFFGNDSVNEQMEMLRVLFTPLENKRVNKFLDIVDSFIPIKSIKKEILETFGIKAIANEEEFYQSLNQLIRNNEIEKARAEVNQIEYDDHVLFKFANLLKDNGYLSDALNTYQDIPQKNSNYLQANKYAEEILLTYANNVDLTLEEKIENLESRIRVMLRANDPNQQNVVDRHFAELAHNTGMVVNITNIGVNENTIINVAHAMAKMQQEIQRLSQENQQLKDKVSTYQNDNNNNRFSPRMFQ